MIENSVTIVIPVKNGMPMLGEVLDGIDAQDYNHPVEVVGIDSGSSDGSDALIDARGHKLIRIPPAEFGHGRTRNLGVESSRAQYLVFLTQDAVPADPNWLDELVRPMRDDANVAGVFSRHQAHENADPFTAWELDTHFEGLKDFPLCELNEPERYWQDQSLRQIYHYFSNNSSAIRRAVWKKHPLPDVQFAEDQIWAKTIIEAGYKKAYAPNSLISHSHSFGPFETLRRAYDESRAFRKLFGYELGGDWSQVCGSALYLIARDMKLAFHHGWFTSHPLKSISRIFESMAKPVGHRLGSRDRLPKRLQNRISRDEWIKSTT